MDTIELTFLINMYYDREVNGECQFFFEKKLSFDSNITLKKALKVLYNELEIDSLKRQKLLSKNANFFIINNDFFSLEFGFTMFEPEDFDASNCFLSDLENQFNISHHVLEVLVGGGIGGGVGDYHGIHFFFHTNEKDLHHNPHIHCKYSGEEIRIDLNKLMIMDKCFKNNRINKLALICVKKNQEQLIRYWNDVVIKGEKIKFKMIF